MNSRLLKIPICPILSDFLVNSSKRFVGKDHFPEKRPKRKFEIFCQKIFFTNFLEFFFGKILTKKMELFYHLKKSSGKWFKVQIPNPWLSIFPSFEFLNRKKEILRFLSTFSRKGVLPGFLREISDSVERRSNNVWNSGKRLRDPLLKSFLSNLSFSLSLDKLDLLASS